MKSDARSVERLHRTGPNRRAEHFTHCAHGGIAVDRLFRGTLPVFGRNRITPGGRENFSGHLGLRDLEANRLAVMLRQRLGQAALDLRPTE